MELLILIYIALGYWAAGVVIYNNRIVFHAFGMLVIQKLCVGIFFGIFLIPIAIIKRLFQNK